MAFAKTGLSVLSPGKAGINVFVYKTSDAEATVEGANYFDSIATTLAEGDLIIAKMSDSFKTYEVSDITSGAVTVAERVTLAAPSTVIADYTLTLTSGTLTAADTGTIATAATPTVGELGQIVFDLADKLNTLNAACKAHGIVATA